MRPITIAQTGAGGSAVVPLDVYLSPFQVTLTTLVSGTVNYDIQYTSDDIWATSYNPAVGNWTSVTGLTGLTAAGEATLISAIRAVRILQNSGSGTTTLRVVQAGAL